MTTRELPAVPLPLTPRDARRALQSVLGACDWHGDVDAVILAVHEALVNAERHGGGLTRVAVLVDGENVTVEVCDNGHGFDANWLETIPPDPMEERGRGLWLITQIARRVEVHHVGGGVCLRLRFDASA